jgi:hypothetical protein
MRPGRELDTLMATEVLGHTVKVKQKELWEDAAKGDRPLRKYSRESSAALEIMEKLNISVIPVAGGQWFAMVGKLERWESPADFLQYLSSGNFKDSGAAVGVNFAETICLAAANAVEARKNPVMTCEVAPPGLDSETVRH